MSTTEQSGNRSETLSERQRFFVETRDNAEAPWRPYRDGKTFREESSALRFVDKLQERWPAASFRVTPLTYRIECSRVDIDGWFKYWLVGSDGREIKASKERVRQMRLDGLLREESHA